MDEKRDTKEVEPLTIERALQEAVVSGRMTEQEATECARAYERAFLGHPDDDDPLATPLWTDQNPPSIYD